MSSARLSTLLTDEERQAAVAYGADSRFFHACWQGRGDDVCHDPEFSDFSKTYTSITSNLDSAVAKSVLHQDVTLFSGHGRGYSVSWLVDRKARPVCWADLPISRFDLHEPKSGHCGR